MRVSVLGLAFLIMLVLKLLGYIAISWWWVTVPLWGPTALLLAVALVALLIGGSVAGLIGLLAR